MNASTGNPGPSATARKLIIMTAILMLLSALFLVPGSAMGMVGPWFWFTVVFILMLLWSVLAGPKAAERDQLEGPHMLSADEQPEVVRDVMEVRLAEQEHGVRLFRGRLRTSADAVFAKLKASFGEDT